MHGGDIWQFILVHSLNKYIHGTKIETGIQTSFITIFQGFENRDISENVEVRDKSMLVSILGVGDMN